MVERSQFHLSTVARLLESNPQLDVTNFNTFDEAQVQALDLCGLGREEALEELRTRQRLIRVAGHTFACDLLLAGGYTSAHAISARAEDVFVAEWESVLPGGAKAAREIHRRATTARGQVLHLWGTLHGTVAARASAGLPFLNHHRGLSSFFTGLPTWKDLFPADRLCECRDCDSIFGPAAYFVDLMRIADRYIAAVNDATIPSAPLNLRLAERRPSLFTQPLTCSASNDLVPYLRIVNDAMSKRLAPEEKDTDLFRLLATAPYPFNLPKNLELTETRLYIQALNTSLAELFVHFAPSPLSNPSEEAVTRERLNLSLEQYRLATTASLDETVLKERYGLTAAQHLADLNQAATFTLQTGLTREALTMALQQGLGAEERRVHLAHGFFFNTPLPPEQAVRLEIANDGTETIVNLTPATLDRLNRFLRLSAWSGVPYADLDWFLASFGATEIDAAAVRNVADATLVSAVYGLPPDSTAALWSDMKTIGAGDGPVPADLFDRIYNSPALVKSGPAYHPRYAKNPALYTDKVVVWDIKENSVDSSSFSRARLAAALGFNESELTALGQRLFGAEAKVSLDVPHLSMLYRAALLLNATALTLDELAAFLGILGLSFESAGAPGNALALMRGLAVVRSLGISVGDLSYVLTGDISLSDASELDSEILYEAAQTIWTLSQPQLVTPEALVADVIDASQARTVFALLLEKGSFLVSVRAAYERVFEQPLGSDLALTPTRATAAALKFLEPDFSPTQIKVVTGVLQRAYDAQLGLLEGQLSTLFEFAPKLAGALREYVARASPLKRFLLSLLTPHRFDEPGWNAAETTMVAVSRGAFAATVLRLSPQQLQCIANHPQAFALTSKTLLQPTFDSVSAFNTLHGLARLWNKRDKELLAFLAMPSESDKKLKSLSKLCGAPVTQLLRLAEYWNTTSAVYDTLSGLDRLQKCLGLLASTGLDAFSIETLLALRELPVSLKTWPQWQDATQAAAALAKAKSDANWAPLSARVESEMNGQRRDVLLWRLLWRLRQKDARFVSPRQLSDLLLIDVERSGCADISLIVEGLNAVQLYLQRCRLNLEQGVSKIPIPEVWWEWMLNYRIWEANRRIFLYPENYLVPGLRKSKTALFRSLEESLQQSDLSPAQVAPAYKTYLDGISTLATLTCVDACRYTVEDVRRGPQDTMFLFARTQAEPFVYYYARKEGETGWSEWKKIDVLIGSRHVSPVYAFNRTFLFWVELKSTSTSKIKAEEAQQASVSENEMVYTATVRYTFCDFNERWVAAQTLYADQVTWVAPSRTPFGDSSGYELFDMDSLYWRKVSVVRVTPEAVRDAPENTIAAEKLTVLYGPFLNNNIDGIEVDLPDRPSASRAASDPARFDFEEAIYDAAVEVRQALRTTVRGPNPLRNATTMNGDLDRDFLLRNTEFPVLRQNNSPGVPPALVPKLDRPTSQLAVAPALNVLRANYDGDYTSPIGSAALSRLADDTTFIASGLDAGRSAGIYADLIARGVLQQEGRVSPLFNRNTGLLDLFEDDPRTDAERFVAVLQRILFGLRARGDSADSSSFLLDPIDASRSAQTYGLLVEREVVDPVGRVSPLLTSATDLSFLFPGCTEPQKGLLIEEVRWLLFVRLGDPVLLESVSQETASVTVVKNQPGWFLFNNGNEAFLAMPDAVTLPTISANVKVTSVPSKAKVFPDTFVTPDISKAVSEQIIADLKSRGIVSADDLVVGFSARTDLSFVLAGEKEPQRGIQVAEARRTLLNLPSITGFRYYYELDDRTLKPDSFSGPGISPAASADALAALQAQGIVDDAGIVSNTFSRETDLEFLFPQADPSTRPALIREVRNKLLQAYSAAWQTTLHDLRFRFLRMTTGATGHLSRALFTGGIPALLSLQSQQIPVVASLPFSRYRPTWKVIPPAHFDGAQVDFDGTFGAYYWELFFYSPQLIAANLLADRRFQESLTWLQYIFNPTLRPEPLTAEAFVTGEISRELAVQAFDQLRERDIVTADGSVAQSFQATTPLDFLWPELSPSEKEDRVRQVRNVLLNARTSAPAARFWQFQPFRNHTVESLLKDLTDPAQVAAYNNDPFDPFAVARLRIGAFEKAVFMAYLDTLIAWGDALFAQYTWESLTAASMLYFYAQDLLGERPASAGPCPSQPPTTFQKIKDKYGKLPDGIPQFLIYMENLLPYSPAVVHDLASFVFTDVDPYFCVPENPQLLSYWDNVEDRLYKIRHCLDLEGRPRQIALFQPPIDPLQLVRASSAGQSSFSVLEQQQATVLPYRFTFLLTTARSLVSNVSSLGSALFAALQSRDGEALARLRTRNEIDVLNLTTLTKTQQIEGARLTVEGLLDSAQAVSDRQQFYADLASEFMNPLEKANLGLSATGLYFQIVSGVMSAASSIAHALPQVGSPFAMTYGGIQLGDALDASSQVYQLYSQVADFAASTMLTVAGYQRRAQDWQFSADQARVESRSMEKQIAAARQQLATAQRELEVHLRTIESNKREAEFLTTRFDTQELYAWMAGRLSTLYFETYRLALDASLAAQSAYRFELDKDDSFINLDFWDSLRQGLLAGESLGLSLDRMEAAYLKNSGRRLLIDKTVSLVATAPEELFRLKTSKTGECTISITEAMLDLDFPGHYCRQLQGVALSVIDAEGETFEEIHGTLTQTRNDVVLSPEKAAVEYLLRPDGAPPASIRSNWQASQQIAVYTGADVTGAGVDFDSLTFTEERYFPFEGTGAVSEWRFQLPPETNPIDFESISDVRLSLRYFALAGGKTFRDEVQKKLSGEILAGGIVIALKQFVGEEEWQAFVDSKPKAGVQTLEFIVDSGLIPPNVRSASLHRIQAQLSVWDVSMPERSDPAFMTLNIEKAEAQKSLVLEDRVYAAVAFDPVLPKAKFLDAWRLEVNVGAMAGRPGLKDLLRPDGRLDPDRFLDLTLALAYRGCVFDCR